MSGEKAPLDPAPKSHAADETLRTGVNHFIAHFSEEGRAWVEESERPEYSAIQREVQRALTLFHRRTFEPGALLLKTVGARLAELRGARPSIVCVLERGYHGVLAYYFYCIDDFDSAQRALIKADEAIRGAIRLDRVLLPIAHDCHEFQLHHARIARNRRRWREMAHHIEVVRAMVDNRLPLCELPDGTKVDYAMLARYCAVIPPVHLSEETLKTARAFGDDAERRSLVDRFIFDLYVLPGFVIPYPPRAEKPRAS